MKKAVQYRRIGLCLAGVGLILVLQTLKSAKASSAIEAATLVTQPVGGVLQCGLQETTSCAADPEAIFTSLAQSGFYWQPLQKQKLFGVPVYLRQFTSELELPKTAQALAQNTPLFQRLLSLPGKVTLSGLYRNWHWLAELNRVSGKVEGRVSAMPVQHVSPNNMPGTSSRATQYRFFSEKERFPWMDPMARLHFRQEIVAGRKEVLHEIYSFPQAAAAVKAHIDKQLASKGWEKSSHKAIYPGAYVWFKDQHQLAFTLNELGPNSRTPGQKTAVFIHYF